MRKIYIMYENDYELCFVRVAKDEEELIQIAKEYDIDFLNEDKNYFYEILDNVDGYKVELVKDGE